MATILSDHEELHHSVARAALAGGAAAVLGLFLPPWLTTALAAAGVSLAIVPPRSWASAAWAVWWAALAGGGARLGGLSGTLLTAGALGASLGRDLGGLRRAAAVTFGVVGALAAELVARAFTSSDALSALPNGVAELTRGAAAGLILGVASIGRHLRQQRPTLDDELRQLVVPGEVGELLGRAATAYREAAGAIGSDAPAARAAADELAQKLVRFGRRWQEVEREAQLASPAELTTRLLQLDQRLTATADPLARLDFTRAREAVATQLAYLGEIAGGRERAVARLSHQVATLERLRLAALHHRSVDAGRLGAELQPVVEELSQAGSDLDLAAEALHEASTEGLGAGTLQAPVRSLC